VRVAHFDCFSGISGDMTLGALIDAGIDAEAIRRGVSSLDLPITLEFEKVRKGGFAATAVRVEAPEEQSHRFLPDIDAILQRGHLTPAQRDLALRIFRRLAEAEAAAHGLPLEKVHFHEVGALDSIADIVGAAIGLDVLGVQRFTSRSVPTGSGMVKCAHGLMPIPTPGTAALLKGVPLASSNIKAELTTPTGAAILTTVVSEWTDHPAMTIEQIGHGAGRREFVDQPNLLRLLVGTVDAPAERDEVWVLETNLDDLPAEIVGYCYDLLLAAGALDVFTTPIFMKKNRPAIMLTVLAPEAAVPALEQILFRETTTFGIRRYPAWRRKLQRRACRVATPWGAIQGKLGWLEGRAPVFSPEFESCAKVAREHGVPLREVYEQAQRSFGLNGPDSAHPSAAEE
jgi:pyridinium-3,5-bisthiocarboxylic acid mononucleotide nickel chelatase